MIPEAHRLHAALVTAFPGYVTGVFAERGYPLDRSSVEAIENATAVLDRELADELARPFLEQRRGPLELFRSALRLTARVLEEGGVDPLQTKGLMSEIDPYGLVPGSSSALGPEAHEAHLAWGSAKAAAFMGDQKPAVADPVILILASNRTERAMLVDALESPGIRCVAARNPAAVATAINESSVLTAAVDLAHRSATDVIARLTAAKISTVAFGDAIDDLTETGLRAQGVRTVVGRQQMLEDPRRYIPSVT
ncbi:MAG: hypothetical protein ABFR89_05520 [Actinomycetota bacterium]